MGQFYIIRIENDEMTSCQLDSFFKTNNNYWSTVKNSKIKESSTVIVAIEILSF